MIPKVVRYTREQLEERRRAIIAEIPGGLEALRRRAASHFLTPEERDVLVDLEGVDFLLGDDET